MGGLRADNTFVAFDIIVDIVIADVVVASVGVTGVGVDVREGERIFKDASTFIEPFTCVVYHWTCNLAMEIVIHSVLLRLLYLVINVWCRAPYYD